MLTFLIHFLSLFALALWVGGGAAISFLVAPVVFEKAGSRKLAGEIIGQVLRRFDLYVLTAGPITAVAVMGELAGAVGGTRALELKLMLVVAMVGLGLYSKFSVTAEIQRLRAELGDQLDALPKEDPRRVAFLRLHGFSVLCLLGEILLGAFALALGVMSLGARPG